MANQMAAEPKKRPTRREVMIARTLMLLALAVLTPLQVALAGTDSTASRYASARDSTLRWQFDTGG